LATIIVWYFYTQPAHNPSSWRSGSSEAEAFMLDALFLALIVGLFGIGIAYLNLWGRM
jgi:hypothetical protein